MMKYIEHPLRILFEALLITLVLATTFLSISGQKNSTECFDVKHLDFFGLEGQDISWPDAEIDGLLKSIDEQYRNNNHFLLPMIVKQIAGYHSCFNKKFDRERFFKLERLYTQMRPGIAGKLIPLSFIDQRLEVVRQDFYDQIADDVMLSKMIYTMDDWPLKGEEIKSFPNDIIPTTFPTRFGFIKIVQSDQRVLVGAYGKDHQPIWVRILKGTNPERYLKKVDPERVSLRAFDAVTIVNLIADGERLTIYIRPNGRLMFYTHSW